MRGLTSPYFKPPTPHTDRENRESVIKCAFV